MKRETPRSSKGRANREETMDDLDRFERAVIEFFQQIALPQAQRDAPNTEWWSTCAAVADSPQAMPAVLCARLSLPVGATYAQGAIQFISELMTRCTTPAGADDRASWLD
jgi:hypothetical protein